MSAVFERRNKTKSPTTKVEHRWLWKVKGVDNRAAEKREFFEVVVCVMIAGEIWVHFGMFWVYNTRIAGGFDMFRFAPPPPVSFFGFKIYKNLRSFSSNFCFWFGCYEFRVKSQYDDARGKKCMNLFLGQRIVPALRRPALQGCGVKTFGASRNWLAKRMEIQFVIQ